MSIHMALSKFKCKYCGKLKEMPFGATCDTWVYKADSKLFCSYSCFTRYKANHEKTIAASRDRMATSGKRWTQDEDDMIVTMRKTGANWTEISNELPGRSPQAVLAHYKAYLEGTA